jgi:putative peptidoglycan lipid II flippase
MGYGFGLMGLVAIKVLAPGFYASQDTKTPVRIAMVVLVLTQLMNLIWVPMFAHAGLALSIGMGAMLNAALLWYYLKRSGRYTPQPGWAKLALQSCFAALLMGAFLHWANVHWDWVALRENALTRIGLLAVLVVLGMGIYGGVMWILGFRIKALLTPQKSQIK